MGVVFARPNARGATQMRREVPPQTRRVHARHPQQLSARRRSCSKLRSSRKRGRGRTSAHVMPSRQAVVTSSQITHVLGCPVTCRVNAGSRSSQRSSKPTRYSPVAPLVYLPGRRRAQRIFGQRGGSGTLFHRQKKKLTSLEVLEYITTIYHCAGEKRQRS